MLPNEKSNGNGGGNRIALSSLLQREFNTWVFRSLPVAVSRRYLDTLGRLYFLLDNAQRQDIVSSLAHFAQNTPGSLSPRQLWPQVRAGIISHYHEKLFLGFARFPRVRKFIQERVSISGLGPLRQAVARGRGVILVTGHFGGLEYLPCTLAFQGLPLTVMVHCRSEELRLRLEERARLCRAHLMDPKTKSTFFEAVEHLRQGRVLVTQCDELDSWHPYPGRRIDFLGLNMGLDRSLDLLARKAGCPVFFGLVHRRGQDAYHLPLQPVTPQITTSGLKLYSAACLQMLNERIAREPQAWYEWRKLAPLVAQQAGTTADDHSWILPVPGEMAVPTGR
jgi:Kdo2-lipid IVA lauroyltransferase/acyltransferase